MMIDDEKINCLGDHQLQRSDVWVRFNGIHETQFYQDLERAARFRWEYETFKLSSQRDKDYDYRVVPCNYDHDYLDNY